MTKILRKRNSVRNFWENEFGEKITFNDYGMIDCVENLTKKNINSCYSVKEIDSHQMKNYAVIIND